MVVRAVTVNTRWAESNFSKRLSKDSYCLFLSHWRRVIGKRCKAQVWVLYPILCGTTSATLETSRGLATGFSINLSIEKQCKRETIFNLIDFQLRLDSFSGPYSFLKWVIRTSPLSLGCVWMMAAFRIVYQIARVCNLVWMTGWKLCGMERKIVCATF